MNDRWGCKSDYEQELIAIAEQESHDAGECKGAPRCGICLDLEEENEINPTSILAISANRMAQVGRS